MIQTKKKILYIGDKMDINIGILAYVSEEMSRKRRRERKQITRDESDT